MKKIKSLICFVSLVVVTATAIVIACGGGFYEDDYSYDAYFRKDLPEEPQYNYYLNFLNEYDNSADRQKDKELNIAEWQHHLGGKIDTGDVRRLVYDISITDLQAIQAKAAQRQWKAIDKTWLSNTMLQRLAQTGNLEAVNYLLFARECEQQAGRRSEDWDTPEYDSQRQTELLKTARLRYSSCKDAFLQQRYAFQAVRMAFYLNKLDDCINDYRKMFEPLKTTAQAKLWAMSFYAGALGRSIKALYAYSRVFTDCPRYAQAAMRSFRWFSHDMDTTGLAALCQDHKEKAMVFAMLGMNDAEPDIASLVSVYEQWPECPALETLLVREISKIEYYSVSETSSEFNDYFKKLNNIVIRYAGEGKVQRQAMWYTAAAYLAQIADDNENASLLLSIAEKAHPDAKTAEQLRVVQLLIETNTTMLTPADEARLLPALQWLVAQKQDEKLSAEAKAYYNRLLAHYFGERLSTLYLSNDQPVKAALCLALAQRYSDFVPYTVSESAFDILDHRTNIKQLQAMLDQMQAKEKRSVYESFLYSACQLTPSAILELMGTKELRMRRFREAAVYFEQLTDASSLFHLSTDPFAPPAAFSRNVKTSNHAEGDSEAEELRSKLTFAVEMADLRDKIKATNDPKAAFRYACGMFQMTCFGNSWQLLTYYWSVADKELWADIKRNDELYSYVNTAIARDIFLQAAEMSKDNEFKAKCTFYAAFCFQMTYSKAYGWTDDEKIFNDYLKDNPYFAQMKAMYRYTKFYEDAQTRCSYLCDFIKMKD